MITFADVKTKAQEANIKLEAKIMSLEKDDIIDGALIAAFAGMAVVNSGQLIKYATNRARYGKIIWVGVTKSDAAHILGGGGTMHMSKIGVLGVALRKNVGLIEK